jgi:hypothetical protein
MCASTLVLDGAMLPKSNGSEIVSVSGMLQVVVETLHLATHNAFGAGGH